METTNIAAESALLASIWLDEDRAGLLDKLEQRDFVDPFCQWLCEVLQETKEHEGVLDMVAVMRRARRPAQLAKLGKGLSDQLAYQIASVLDCEATSAHAAYYFGVVRAERLKRAVLSLASAIVNRVQDQHEPKAILEFVATNCDRLLGKV